MLGKVLITAKSVLSCDEALQHLIDAGCDLDLPKNPSSDEQWLIGRVHDADALVVAMEPVTQRVVDAAKNLKIIPCGRESHILA